MIFWVQRRYCSGVMFRAASSICCKVSCLDGMFTVFPIWAVFSVGRDGEFNALNGKGIVEPNGQS